MKIRVFPLYLLGKSRGMIRRRKKKGGYHTHHKHHDVPERAYRLALLGLRNNDLAVAFGVSNQTIEYWMRTWEDFRDAVNLGKQEADAKVADSLYRKAVGYSHPDTYITIYKGQVLSTPIIKYYPPDTGACVFWLTNRQSDKWQNTRHVQHSGDLKFRYEENDLSDFTNTELEALKKFGLKELKANEPHSN